MNRQKIKLYASSVAANPKEGRTPLLNANNPPGRILLWELLALRESALNGYSPTGNSSRLRSLEKVEIFEGGEREADLLVHALSN